MHACSTKHHCSRFVSLFLTVECPFLRATCFVLKLILISAIAGGACFGEGRPPNCATIVAGQEFKSRTYTVRVVGPDPEVPEGWIFVAELNPHAVDMYPTLPNFVRRYPEFAKKLGISFDAEGRL